MKLDIETGFVISYECSYCEEEVDDSLLEEVEEYQALCPHCYDLYLERDEHLLNSLNIKRD